MMRRTPHGESDGNATYGALLDAVRGLRWRALRVSRMAVPGIHPSRVRGTSAEFTEYRAYRQGDDLRRIDWKLFARSDRAHIRISEERAVTPTYLVLDASASMAYPDGDASKWKLAQQMTVALSAVAHAGGDPVGLIVAGRPRATIPPRTRSGIVAEIIHKLHDVEVKGTSPLSPAVVLAARSAARVVIVSDFLGDLDDTLRVAREMVAAGRDIHALHIIAADEVNPAATASLVTDPEDDHIRRYMADSAREGYVRAYAEWREATAARWLASGAAYRPIVTGAEPVSHSVHRIVRDEAVASRIG